MEQPATTTLARRLFGTDEPVEAALPLHAGPLSMRLRRGRLLHLCCDGREVWHGVAFVLRDADWGTPEPVFETQRVETFDGGFRVRLEGGFPVSPPVRLVVSIEGDADGRLRFDAEATPAGDIEANRIGLCLMHPSDAGGAAVEIGHVDGRSSRSTLPRLIPPWPPFMLIRSIAHEWAPGCWADAELLGDSFELEDQRNNADASFKTYSRSNLMPRPYRLPAGVPIRQSALLSLRSRPAATAAPDATSAPIVVEVGAPCGDLPRIGIEIHADDIHADAALLDALRRLRPAHLHLSLLDDGDARGVEPRGLAALLAAAARGCGSTWQTPSRRRRHLPRRTRRTSPCCRAMRRRSPRRAAPSRTRASAAARGTTSPSCTGSTGSTASTSSASPPRRWCTAPTTTR